MTGGLSGDISRKIDGDIFNLYRESKSFVVVGRKFHGCTGLTWNDLL